MAMMLATQNPEAAARIADTTPLPTEGDIILFFPRPSEIRAGKRSVPALVLKSDQDNAQLDLLVIYDADDMHSLQRVPRRQGDDRGWEQRAPAGSAVSVERFEAFMAEMGEAMFGLEFKPVTSLLEMLTELSDRVKTLEKAKPRRAYKTRKRQSRSPAPEVT